MSSFFIGLLVLIVFLLIVLHIERTRIKIPHVEWIDYDPSWLVRAAQFVQEEYPWLPEKLKECVKAIRHGDTPSYIYFVNSYKPNKSGSDWQFKENIILEDTEHGDVVLDILEGDRIGGVEILKNIKY